MKLWIVGQDKDETWEFVGVFSSQERTDAACLDVTYFVGPADLDNRCPIESVEWEGGYRPNSSAPLEFQ